MKRETTELVFVLDKSGSMSGLETDTIGGFNAMLKKQQNEEGQCLVTTVLFDNNYELLHDRIDIRALAPITDREYYVGGSTALLDAVGRTIHKINNVQKQTDAEYRAGKVLFIIITDGQENSSREYTLDKVKALIESQKAEYGWEFVFLGANIDAVEAAGRIGIDATRAQNYHADKAGVGVTYQVMNDMVSSYRKAAIPSDWKKDLEDDFKKRDTKPR